MFAFLLTETLTEIIEIIIDMKINGYLLVTPLSLM